MLSPSKSLAVNRLDAATNVLPLVNVTLALGAVTTGGVSTGPLTVKGFDPAHLFDGLPPLHWVPSLAATHSVDVAAPPWYCACAGCPAVTSISCPVPCATPLSKK